MRSIFSWKFEGVKICRSFFSLIYSVSKNVLNRYEKRFKEGDDYQKKLRGGNHKLNFIIYDELKIFLNYYFINKVLPHPLGHPLEHLLPSSFSIRGAYNEYSTAYTTFHNTQSSGRCWI